MPLALVGHALQILRLQSSRFGNSSEHTRADLFSIVEGPCETLAAAHKLEMGACASTLHLLPPDSFQRLENLASPRAWPQAHAAANFT